MPEQKPCHIRTDSPITCEHLLLLDENGKVAEPGDNFDFVCGADDKTVCCFMKPPAYLSAAGKVALDLLEWWESRRAMYACAWTVSNSKNWVAKIIRTKDGFDFDVVGFGATFIEAVEACRDKYWQSFARVDGFVLCPGCWKPAHEHNPTLGRPDLTELCGGELVKL